MSKCDNCIHGGVCHYIMFGGSDEIEECRHFEEQPKGKWIFNKYNVWECSCCGGNPHAGTGYVPSIPMMKKQWKFCNLCGAQMGVDDNETDN